MLNSSDDNVSSDIVDHILTNDKSVEMRALNEVESYYPKLIGIKKT